MDAQDIAMCFIFFVYGFFFGAVVQAYHEDRRVRRARERTAGAKEGR